MCNTIYLCFGVLDNEFIIVWLYRTSLQYLIILENIPILYLQPKQKEAGGLFIMDQLRQIK